MTKPLLTGNGNFFPLFQNFKEKFSTGADRWIDKQDFVDEEDDDVDDDDDDGVGNVDVDIDGVEWIEEPVEPFSTKFGEGVFRKSPMETTTKRTITTATPTDTTAATATGLWETNHFNLFHYNE